MTSMQADLIAGRVERKYAMTRLAAGDYLLPSNDGKWLWRIRQYTEGPSSGLDWPTDRTVWGTWRWTGELRSAQAVVDPDDWDTWEFWEGTYETRGDAIKAALR